MPYFEVKCKCGHVGRNHYIPISFAIFAKDAKDAALIARWMPRCKHHQKDCVIEVKKITFKQYMKLREENENDPYLKCHSIQEQREYDLYDRICNEYSDDSWIDEDRIKTLYIGKTFIKNPKKYIRLYKEESYEQLE